MSEPLISVVIPTWNGESFVAEAVASALGQTYREREVIVVDDGSSDGTAALLESFGAEIRVLSQPNRGTSAARNLGVAACHGALLAFLDHDDVWMPSKLEVQAALLGQRRDVDLVFCRMRMRRDPPEAAPKALVACCPSGLVARREAWERVGPFDETIAGAEFADWYLRARKCGLRQHTVAHVLLDRRVHPGNQSRGAAARASYLHVLGRHLRGRRGAAS